MALWADCSDSWLSSWVLACNRSEGSFLASVCVGWFLGQCYDLLMSWYANLQVCSWCWCIRCSPAGTQKKRAPGMGPLALLILFGLFNDSIDCLYGPDILVPSHLIMLFSWSVNGKLSVLALRRSISFCMAFDIIIVCFLPFFPCFYFCLQFI